MSQPVVTLRPLTHTDLDTITPWFADPDTRPSLGGPEWPAAMLARADESVGTTFRGAQQTGADHYPALADGVPVGYIDCGTFDRCTVYGGEGPNGPIILDPGSVGAPRSQTAKECSTTALGRSVHQHRQPREIGLRPPYRGGTRCRSSTGAGEGLCQRRRAWKYGPADHA
jgi:hypothetical protein